MPAGRWRATTSVASPGSTVAGLIAVYEASREAFVGRTAITLPGLNVTVQQMLDAIALRDQLERDLALAGVAGGEVVVVIDKEHLAGALLLFRRRDKGIVHEAEQRHIAAPLHGLLDVASCLVKRRGRLG